MYPVKITRVSTNDDSEFVISGTTDAPEGAKILAKSPVKDDTDNEANPANSDNDSYEKVSSNGKFKIIINSEHLKTSGEKLKFLPLLVTKKNLKMLILVVIYLSY